MTLDAAFARVVALAAFIDGVVVSTGYGTPALKLGGKMIVRMKDDDTLVLMCPLDKKDMLMAAAPPIYFETDHYRGYPAVPVRLSAIGDR